MQNVERRLINAEADGDCVTRAARIMRSFDDAYNVPPTPTKITFHYSDDEILQDSALVVDDVICVDVGDVARRKSADCGDRRTYFEPYSRLDVEHHPLSVQEPRTERRRETPNEASVYHVDSHFSRPRSARDVSTPASTSAAATKSRDRDVTRRCDGDSAAVSCRRRFIAEQMAQYECRAPITTTTASASRPSNACIRLIGEQSQFVVCRRDGDQSSTASSSSSSPSSRLLGRLAPQPSPLERLPPTSRKTEQRSASAGGGLRRSNSVSGSSGAGRSLQSGDEGFADGRSRTSEARRMSRSSGDKRHVHGEMCCLCRDAVSRRLSESQSNVASSASDQARKRSYRVGLNLFNKYVMWIAFNDE